MEETLNVRGSPEKVLSVWSVFHDLVGSGAVKVNGEELDLIHRELREGDPCPRHHSEPYRTAYYPAYRVVKREALGTIPRFQG